MAACEFWGEFSRDLPGILPEFWVFCTGSLPFWQGFMQIFPKTD
jgi:hypothetical protein